ncbi:MAG: hypothetical protein ACTSQ4_11625 [Candidatus Heimdallarchaeaceae archaeon]
MNANVRTNESKDFKQIELDILYETIEEELKKIKQIKKQIDKLIAQTKIGRNRQISPVINKSESEVLKQYSSVMILDQKQDLSVETNKRNDSNFVSSRFVIHNTLMENEDQLKKILVLRLKETIEFSNRLRKDVKKLHDGSDFSIGQWVDSLTNDSKNLNMIFGPLNQNGERNVKELGNHLLEDFNDSENGDYLKFKKTDDSSGLKQFLMPLEPSESDSCVRVLLSKFGVKGITSTHTAESFLKAQIKLNFEKDKMRRFWNINGIPLNLDKVLIRGLKCKFSSSNGFDDLMLGVIGKGKSTKYDLRIVEMKVGEDLGGFFDYIRTNKNERFTSQICDDVSSFLKVKREELSRLDINLMKVHDIVAALNNKYLFTTSGMGFDFNKKIKSGNLRNALIDSGLSKTSINKILKGAIKQNQLISLIQNGNAHKIVTKNGYFTVADEIVPELELKLKTRINTNDKFVSIKLHRNSFLPNFVKMKDGTIKLSLELLDTHLRNMKKLGKQSSDTYKTYLVLNTLLRSALDKFSPCLIHDTISEREVVKKLNEMQRTVYYELMKLSQRGIIKEFSVFKCGMMFHCLETLNDLGQKTFKKLTKNFESKSVVPYKFHQHWECYYSLEKIFKKIRITQNSDFLNGWSKLKDKFFGSLLSNDSVNVTHEEEVWQCYLDNPNWIQKILRDLKPPYKIPDGLNLSHKSKLIHPIIFFDRKTITPIEVVGFNKRLPWIGVKFHLNQFFKTDKTLSKMLLQLPLKINVRGVEFSNSKQIVDAWKKRLIQIGIPIEQVDLLGTKYNFRNSDGDFNIKLVFAIIFEYQKVWKNLFLRILEYIQTIDDWSFFLPSSIDPQNGSRIRIVKKEVQFDYTGNGDWKEVILGFGTKHGTDSWNVRKEINRTFIFPIHNNLFNKLIEDIQFHIWKEVLDSPSEIAVEETWDFIISNWKIFN